MLTQSADRWVDRSDANASLTAPYAPFGLAPRVGDALYLGFDRALGAADARVRLWLFGEDLERDVGDWLALRAEWRRNLRARRRCARDVRWHAHYGARVAWEYFDGQSWRGLANLADRTRSLSLSGPVRWRVRTEHAPGGVPGHEARYFIRCRLVEGEFDCAPVIRGLRLNTVLAHHAADVAGTVTPARSTGAAHQRFRLSRAPAVPGSVRTTLTTAEGLIESDWRECADFDRSGPHAKDFVLDASVGDIEFGNGRAGAVPEAGTNITAHWRIGGGALGNVPALTLTAGQGAASSLSVAQLVAACRGADAETLDATKARAYRNIQIERCAATLAISSASRARRRRCLLRARSPWPSRIPTFPVSTSPGCVSIVIVPSCVERHRDPTPALCAAVANHLESRRPLALELHVIGPRYTVVNVTARLALVRGARAAEVSATARAALAKFLHPLDGGPEGGGWKVGRAVYRSEVLAVLGAIAGVHHVAELALDADDGGAALCGDIPICANGLVVSGEHEINFIDGAGR